jgi:hypothetical protein
VRIRVARLKETRESTCIAFIHNRIGLLNRVDTIPLLPMLA